MNSLSRFSLSRFSLFVFSSMFFLSLIPNFKIHAQEIFPSSPINIIVANPPGGAADLNARLFQEPWSSVLKQPLVIQHKPGLGGAIGTAQFLKLKPDGYNVLLGLSSVMVHPEAERNLGKKPLYELDQLEPIALLSSDPLVILVKADAPWKTINDVVRDAKSNPGKLTYSSSGNFGPVHIAIEMLAQQAGVKLTQIPFTGGGPALISLLSGQVDLTAQAPAVAQPHIISGKLRALAVSGAKRIPLFPEVPTYIESGFDAQYSIWAGLYVQKGIPLENLQTLRETVKQAAKLPQYITSLQKQNIVIDYRDAPDFQKFAEEDGKRMIKLIRNMEKEK